LGLLGHCPEAGLSGQCPLGDVGVASRLRRFLRWHRTARALKEIDQELDGLVALGSGVGFFGTCEQARGEISTSPNQTTRDVFDRLGLVVDHRRLDLVGTALRQLRPKGELSCTRTSATTASSGTPTPTTTRPCTAAI
jgi:hypothetical protein